MLTATQIWASSAGRAVTECGLQNQRMLKDFNSSSFQLQLGSWPNREMQEAYKADPSSFQWVLLKKLDYKELDEDLSDDLELLYMEVMDEYPNAKPMRRRR